MQDRKFTRLLVAAFLGLGIVGILHHEMWFDELQAWLVARDSDTIADLFRNLKYEGHPILWYLCLYALNRITSSPLTMQWFHLLIAAVVVYVFADFSPFSRLQKILFSFGYFPFYEYCLISRSYSLGILLIFLFCILFSSNQKNYIAIFFVLALLANANVHGLMISVVLGATVIVKAVVNRDLDSEKSHPIIPMLPSIGILLVGISLSVIQISPPSDRNFGWTASQTLDSISASYQSPLTLALNQGKEIAQVLLNIWEAYIPMPNIFVYGFWSESSSTNIVTAFPLFIQGLAVLSSLGLLVFSVFLVKENPVSLFLYTLGTGSLLVFNYLVYDGYLRHHGHFFFLLLVCLWISQAIKVEDKGFEYFKFFTQWMPTVSTQTKALFLTVILSLHLCAGMFAVAMDLKHPFTVSREVAEYIKSHRLDRLPIVAYPAYPMLSLAAYLDQTIYDLEVDREATFIVWTKDREKLETSDVFDKLGTLSRNKDLDILLVSNEQFSSRAAHENILELATFGKGIVPVERYYYLYLFEK